MEKQDDSVKQVIEDAISNDMKQMFGPTREALKDPYLHESLNTLYGLYKANHDAALKNGFTPAQALTIVSKLAYFQLFGGQ